jgi:ribosomal subunit interface protein
MKMQLYLTARHIELTAALRNHVERHLRDAIEGHANVRAVRMEVQLYRTGEREVRYGCHVLLELSRRHDINIREEDRDLYAAIDLAEKRLMHAVTNYRDRQLTEGRHSRKYSFERLGRALGWVTRRAERRKKRSHSPSV